MRLALFTGLLTLLLAAPALAITNGVADGNTHPNAGAFVAADWLRPGQKDVFCSGTLISPTVFLTAAHCTSYLESLGISQVWVTFDEKFSSKAKLYPGHMYTHPLYGHDEHDPHDIAVIVLDQAVKGITPARLPPAGLFDQLKAAGTLSSQLFTNAGYGGQERVIQPGGPVIGYNDAREYSVSSFNALNDYYMRLSQNAATGDAGTCYGDSGGPQFLGAGSSEQNMVVSTTITGDSQCVSTNVTYRLDTASARNFLAQFVTLP
ncbi:MAG: trypsin-like serine protease [Hyalangium sp.]|uniref:trypsin-like serine protease n=1 Tax=Hyalangium sp. TaxID=2028555 RepID=UPI00389AB7BD